jgi:outer membrane protein assembly factor BamB
MFFRMLDADRDGMIRADEWPRIHGWMESWTHANGLIALRPGDDGSTPSLAWKHEIGVPECPTPLIWQGRLYAVRNGGVVTCLETSTGALHYQDRLVAGGPYYASPVGGDGKIYFASARGTVSVAAAEATPRVLHVCELGEPISATPALVDNQVIIRSAQHVWLFAEDANP